MSAPVVTNTGLVLNGFNFRTATFRLTNAQIKALPTTEYVLDVAPGAGKMWRPVEATLRCASTAAAYTLIDTTYAALSLSYLNAAGPWAALFAVNSSTSTPPLTLLTDLLGASDNTVFVGPYSSTPGDEGYVLPTLIGESFIVNQPLVLAFDNNGGAGTLGGGNVANFMDISVTYKRVG